MSVGLLEALVSVEVRNDSKNCGKICCKSCNLYVADLSKTYKKYL